MCVQYVSVTVNIPACTALLGVLYGALFKYSTWTSKEICINESF